MRITKDSKIRKTPCKNRRLSRFGGGGGNYSGSAFTPVGSPSLSLLRCLATFLLKEWLGLNSLRWAYIATL